MLSPMLLTFEVLLEPAFSHQRLVQHEAVGHDRHPLRQGCPVLASNGFLSGKLDIL